MSEQIVLRSSRSRSSKNTQAFETTRANTRFGKDRERDYGRGAPVDPTTLVLDRYVDLDPGRKSRSRSRSGSSSRLQSNLDSPKGTPRSFGLDCQNTELGLSWKRFDSKTRTSLKDLKEALLCHNSKVSKCNHQEGTQKLFSLGTCEHRFCKSCVEGNQTSSCSICYMPYGSANVHLDKQLSNIAALCENLSNILEGKPEESIKSELCRTTTYDSSAEVEPLCVSATPQEAAQLKPESDVTAEPGVQSTPRSRKRSDRFTHLKGIPLKDEIQETPNKTPRGRKRSSIHTPSNSDNSKIKRKPLDTPEETKRITPRGKQALSNAAHKSVNESGTGEANISEKTTSLARHIKRTITSDASENVCGRKSSGRKETKENRKKIGYDSNSLSTNNSAHESDAEILQSKTILKLDGEVTSPSPSHKKNSMKQRTPCNSNKTGQASLEKRNAKGETPLQVAAVKNDLEKVDKLLKGGANPNVKDNAGWTPLHEAVNHGNARIAELLLNHGASVNAPGLENDTPLHDAVTNYSLECVRLLVKRGANITARNTHGQTALDLAMTEDMKDALLVPGGAPTHSANEAFVEEDICSGLRLCFVTSSLSKEEQLSAQNCAKLLDVRLVDNHSSEVTHSINGVNAEGLCPRTIKYLSAVLSGSWIVNAEWIHECVKEKQRVPEDKFEVAGCVSSGQWDTPHRARLNRLRKLPGLFDGCQFYFFGKFSYPTPSKEELTNLAKLGGACTILTREPHLYKLDDYAYTVPYHAASTNSLSECTIFVIYDDSCPNPPQVKAQRMSYLPASWFLDSIAAFTLLDKAEYFKH